MNKAKFIVVLLIVSTIMASAFAVAEEGEGVDLAAITELMPDMENHYWDFAEAEQPLEQKYTALGSHEVSYLEMPVEDESTKLLAVWYPADLAERESWPVVIFVNGTGFKASGYQANFRHLASWGFIAVGNEDENTRTGASTEVTLLRLLQENENPDSLLYGKIDTARIGLTGHSQGGVGIYNAIGNQPHGEMYAAVFPISATSSYWGQEGVFGTNWAYDLSRIHMPVFMGAGTGMFDAGTADNISLTEGQGITPLWSLEMNLSALPDDIIKGYARMTGKDHGDTLKSFDGYMTAWFLWHLCGDEEAAQVYIGDDPEILRNSRYQDVVIVQP